MHLAAETDVDLCEVNPEHAYKTNTMGTLNVALNCRSKNIDMVYISTLGVFDGNKVEPYNEFDEPNPINQYGKAKYEGEKIVERLLSNHYIVRAGWMIGGGPLEDKKFVSKIIDQIDKVSPILAVSDKIGTPTYTYDFSKVICELIKTPYYGLYHCTSKGVCTRYDVALKILECMGRPDYPVKMVSSAHFPLAAPRPRCEASVNYKLQMLGLDTTRQWDIALKEYIKNFW